MLAEVPPMALEESAVDGTDPSVVARARAPRVALRVDMTGENSTKMRSVNQWAQAEADTQGTRLGARGAEVREQCAKGRTGSMRYSKTGQQQSDRDSKKRSRDIEQKGRD